MKLLLPRVVCPHSTSAATTSRPKPCPCALSLSQRPSSGETESASSNEAMPMHSLLSSRRMMKENLFGSGACTLFSHRVTYSLHDGGSHGMNLAMAGVMHPKTSCASIIWNWLSCNLRDWMRIIVSAYQRRIIRQLMAGENRRLTTWSGWVRILGGSRQSPRNPLQLNAGFAILRTADLGCWRDQGLRGLRRQRVQPAWRQPHYVKCFGLCRDYIACP